MISREEIQNLAQLARLELSDEEATTLQKDMSTILEYVDQLAATPQGDALRNSDVKASPLPYNVLRADEERGADDPMAGKRDALLQAFPKREGDYLVVRKIIQKDE